MADSYRIFVFKSTFLTFKAERAFKSGGVPCKVVTKPRDISSDCGLSVRVDATDEARAEEALTAGGIEKLGVWTS